MTLPSPLALAALPAGPADPSQLALHLEICRLHAELEDLEARIARVRASGAEPDDGLSPFADRAGELVDRVVESMHRTGRSEILAETARGRIEAEARVEEARSRADQVLAEARDALSVALAERAAAVDAVRSLGTERLLAGDGARPVASVPSEGQDLPGPSVGAEAAVVREAPVVGERPVVAEAMVPPAPVVVEDPVVAEAMVPPAETANAGDLEAARTDAAFEAWMAVAPRAAGASRAPVGGPVPDTTEPVEVAPRPSRLVGIVQVCAALVVAAAVMAVLLLFVG